MLDSLINIYHYITLFKTVVHHTLNETNQLELLLLMAKTKI